MEFTLDEKMALIKITTDVIKADGILHEGEMKFFEQLKKRIGFDIPHVEAAEDWDIDTATVFLNKMTYSKKKAVAEILKEVAVSDNSIHEKEMTLILAILANIGLGEEID